MTSSVVRPKPGYILRFNELRNLSSSCSVFEHAVEERDEAQTKRQQDHCAEPSTATAGDLAKFPETQRSSPKYFHSSTIFFRVPSEVKTTSYLWLALP